MQPTIEQAIGAALLQRAQAVEAALRAVLGPDEARIRSLADAGALTARWSPAGTDYSLGETCIVRERTRFADGRIVITVETFPDNSIPSL